MTAQTMEASMSKSEESPYFHEYFASRMQVYKLGAVRPITYQKYKITLRRIRELAPTLRVSEINKWKYQSLINAYAETHERQTVMDFHNHCRAALLDAIDDGLLKIDPARKAIIKGKEPAKKRPKFLSLFQLQAMLQGLELGHEPSWDWLILLAAKTGMRFAEILGLTPSDFDFAQNKVKISKTWGYKNFECGFAKTKNESSKRTISIDPRLAQQMQALVASLPEDKPIFVGTKRIFNSTANNRLVALCRRAGVPEISFHCLRHTHASLLIFAGVSIASIAKRLGHSNITTTQETYLHIIQELEDKDNDKVLTHLGELDR